MLTKYIIIAVMTAGAGSLSIGISPAQFDTTPAAVLLVKSNNAAWQKCYGRCTAAHKNTDANCGKKYGKWPTLRVEMCKNDARHAFEKCAGRCDEKYPL
jgi:hypothetical protein